MSNGEKDIDIENRTYYFFNGIINIKKLDSDNIKIDEKSNKNILIYYIGYMMIENSKYIKIDSVNPLHHIFSKVNWHFEGNNGNKYLTEVPTNESK